MQMINGSNPHPKWWPKFQRHNEQLGSSSNTKKFSPMS